VLPIILLRHVALEIIKFRHLKRLDNKNTQYKLFVWIKLNMILLVKSLKF